MAIVTMISGEWNNLSELTAYSVQASTSSAKKRTGNYSVHLIGGSFAFMQKTIPAQSEVYLQYGWLTANNWAGATFGLRSGSTWLVSISRSAAGYLELRSGSGGALLATGITPITTDRWYLVELHFKLADSGGIAELRIDGNLECTFNGDTKPGSETTFDNLYWSSWASGPDCYYDDVVVHDLSGAVNNGYPGGVKLALIKPTSDGATKEWTPSSGSDHYALVDEAPPSGTDYLRATESDLIDLFGLEDLPAEAQSVKAVALDFHGLKGSTVPPSRIAQIARVGEVDYVQADQDLPLSEGLVRKILDQNPTGGNWTVAAVNALVSGVKSRP